MALDGLGREGEVREDGGLEAHGPLAVAAAGAPGGRRDPAHVLADGGVGRGPGREAVTEDVHAHGVVWGQPGGAAGVGGDGEAVQAALTRLKTVSEGAENTVPAILEAVEAYATVGEIADIFRSVFGEQREFAPF